MAVTDSFAQALKNRRGRHMEGELMQPHDGSHDAIDMKTGIGNAPTVGGERQGTPPGHMDPNPQFDRESTTHLDEHIPVDGEQRAPMPPQPAMTQAHGSLPAADMMMDDEMRDHIAGHGNQADYDQLKERGPKSLGERVKMDALKDKYK